MCLRLCCDPHKLTYISAIITACEAVLFGVLNLVLILLSKCVIQPPDSPLGGGLDRFYAWYFFSEEACYARYGNATNIPSWINVTYPLGDRDGTSVDSNLGYQIAYLTLHAIWIISAFLLLYGNARKRWGYYIPWLLITVTFTFMDVSIASFFIRDMMEVMDNEYWTTGMHEVTPMIWAFSMYLRIYIIWFSNLGYMATAINAFCKTRHKRAKEEHKKKKLEKKHQRELVAVQASAAAQTQEQVALAQAQHANAYPSYPEQRPHQSTPVQDNYDNHNPKYADPYDAPPSYHNAQTRIPAAPKEVRPFSYLNPGFRPENAHDVAGMKTNAAPDVQDAIGGYKGQSYFSAIPPKDYDDDDVDNQPIPLASLPRVNPNQRHNNRTSFNKGIQPHYDRDHNKGDYF